MMMFLMLLYMLAELIFLMVMVASMLLVMLPIIGWWRIRGAAWWWSLTSRRTAPTLARLFSWGWRLSFTNYCSSRWFWLLFFLINCFLLFLCWCWRYSCLCLRLFRFRLQNLRLCWLNFSTVCNCNFLKGLVLGVRRKSFNFLANIKTRLDSPKHDVLIIKVWGREKGDEELWAIRVFACVGHWKQSLDGVS